jgi:kumamolisin
MISLWKAYHANVVHLSALLLILLFSLASLVSCNQPAAPIWAAGQALVNEDTIQRLGTFGYSPRFYYAVADKNAGGNAYFDITSGNNLYYPATPGWDFPTGLGTPNLGSFDKAVSNTLA